MHILKVGFNYKTAPVEIREKLAFSEDDVDQAMKVLKERKSILENVIVSTCNRTEIYAVVDQVHTGRYYIKQFLADWFHEEMATFTSFLQIAENDEAMEHLFRVVTGLDSMVLGETQILGQVRQAFLTAQKTETTGTIFNELFKQAITFGKRVQKDTAIGEHAVSVSYAAVELAKKIFGNLTDKKVAILGAGKMGELAVKNFQGSGVRQITVMNRTKERAESLAMKFTANVEPIENLPNILQKVDILLTSTGSSSVVLTKMMMESVQKHRKGSPLFLVDIAVPRDIDPSISKLDNVFLYDIDDLQHIVDENLEARKKAAQQVEFMLENEIVTFKEWVKTLGVVPIISALRQKALSIQAETVKSIGRKMPDLTEREKKVINKHTKSIVNQLLKEPINQAKELAAKDRSGEALKLFIDIFGIEREVQEELEKQTKKNQIITSMNDKQVSFPLMDKITTI
ncbi:glutamyl-tRNA reductase [Cerasibacillus sp. JNUCC 74]